MDRFQVAGPVLVLLLASAIEVRLSASSDRARLGESESNKLLASDGKANDQLGKSVAVTEGLAIVGAPGDNDAGFQSGSVYAFAFDGDEWEQEQEIFASDARDGDGFGWSVSISSDTAIVGSMFGDDGFERNGSRWSEEAVLLPDDGDLGDWIGFSVAVAGDTGVWSLATP